jgi:hypothetical protein
MGEPAAGEEKLPFPGHDRAVAYAFNQGEDELDPILEDGKLNGTTTAKLTRSLDKDQVARLAALVTGKRAKHEKADCYYPRHAVVFYLDKKPVGFLEVCFECSEYRSDLKGLAEVWDLNGLARFFKELGFPVKWDEDLFNRLNKR